MNSTTFLTHRVFPKNLLYLFFVALFAASFSLQSCSTKMSPRDDYSLEETESIKIETVELMKRAGKDYSTMSEPVNALKSRINNLMDYERDKGEMNTKTVQMWELLMNPDQNLVGGFLNRWKNEGKLNGVFMKEAIGVVSKNFDKITKLERKKKKS